MKLSILRIFVTEGAHRNWRATGTLSADKGKRLTYSRSLSNILTTREICLMQQTY